MKRCFKPILLLAAAAALTSCRGTHSCPNFSNSVVESAFAWIPYEKNDTVLFTSTAADSLQTKLIITNVEISHSTQYDAGQLLCYCNDFINVNGTISGRKFEIFTIMGRNDFGRQRVGYQHFDFPNRLFSQYDEHPTYAIKGVEYKNVRVYDVDNNGGGQIGGYQTLIVAKGVGLVGITDVNYNSWYIKDVKEIDIAAKAKSATKSNVKNNLDWCY